MLDHWENYLGTTLNRIYMNENFRMVLSENLSGPAYNQLVPEKMEADLSGLENISFHHKPCLHGEAEFIDEFRDENFPEAELERKIHWMKFEGKVQEGKNFKLDFSWIGKTRNSDYLEVKKRAFDEEEDYMALHRTPARSFGEDFHRVVAYDDRKPVSAGEIRFGRKGSYIYTLSTVENYRGEGIATEVLKKLLEKANGTVYLMIAPELRDFYHERGFREIFRTHSYTGDSWNDLF